MTINFPTPPQYSEISTGWQQWLRLQFVPFARRHYKRATYRLYPSQQACVEGKLIYQTIHCENGSFEWMLEDEKCAKQK